MRNLFLLITILSINILNAQEVKMELISNKHIQDDYKIRMLNVNQTRLTAKALPFIDDFSLDHFPGNPSGNEILWEDLNAYRNQSYGINPPSIGVVTFDGLNEFGLPYNNFSGTAYGSADTLTSVEIDLDPSSTSIGVVLSFFYQAQGLGNEPQAQDSLVLEFYDVDNAVWNGVWSKEGQSLNDFEQVLIAIEDAKYLKEGFRFRFRNYANLGGSFDHWHIDFVRLDDDRSIGDTELDDLCFAVPIYSLLQNDYISMPWTHYKNAPESYMIDSKEVVLRNNRTSLSTVLETRLIVDYNSIEQNNYSDESVSIVAANSDLPVFQKVHEDPNNYSYDISVNDTLADFEVNISLSSSPNEYSDNDNIHFIQSFKNYYGYSDNTAENAILINGLGSAAYRIDAAMEDTIEAIQMSFVPVGLNSADESMLISIWDDDGFQNSPGTLLYQGEVLQHPDFTNTTNGYKTYYFEEKIFVDNSYFIGWKQTTTAGFAVGNDVSRDNNTDRFYYNTNGNWIQSAISGALMLRPQYVSLIDPPVTIQELKPNNLISWPNPANNSIYFNYESDLNISSAIIYDQMGRTISEQKIHINSIDTSNLSDGIYLISIINANNEVIGNIKTIIIH